VILNHRASPPLRRGFTLIELLTVIAIIAVIMGIAIGAFFRVRVSQEEKATETTIFKIQNQFDAQWRAVLDNAKQDAREQKIPKIVLNGIAGGDNRRALVIWTKMNLKLEFPQCFHEVLVWQPQVQSYCGMSPKSSYQRALQAIPLAMSIDPYTATPAQYPQLMQESAVLLYMSVTQARRGVTGFNPTEHVGPHAVGSVTLTQYPNQPTFPVFIDTWGQPIGFIRWPLNGGVQSDLNQSPQQQLNSLGQAVDPQDPERSLLDNGWVANPNYINAFKQVVGYDPTTSPGLIAPNTPANLNPVICSSGRDTAWGIDPWFGSDGTGNDSDNVYGYRIKGVGRNN
jgi:prepilin-type N-terminal cleavage/methylation domain-containing protein